MREDWLAIRLSLLPVSVSILPFWMSFMVLSNCLKVTSLNPFLQIFCWKFWIVFSNSADVPEMGALPM